MSIFVVTLAAGPLWQGRQDPIHQEGGAEHETFMHTLTDDRFLLLGGPVKDATENRALLVVKAPSEEQARAKLAEDPWVRTGVLAVLDVREWDLRYGTSL